MLGVSYNVHAQPSSTLYTLVRRARRADVVKVCTGMVNDDLDVRSYTSRVFRNRGLHGRVLGLMNVSGGPS